jgi:hypothetical protein
MDIVKLFTIPSALSGMLNSGHVTHQKRRLYSRKFAVVVGELQSASTIYPPPWIKYRLKMAGMRNYLVRRLLRFLTERIYFIPSQRILLNFYANILARSCNFSRYQHHIYDPSRLVITSLLDAKCRSPIGCCWHAGLGKLLVTTPQHIFTVDLKLQPFQFQILYHLPGGNNYGIDVAPDGTIVIIGYNANRVYLISPCGVLIANYVIIPNSSSNYSGVSFSHDGAYIICFSRIGMFILRTSDGSFLFSIGGEGSEEGFFRGEGQISRLSLKNQFVISDIENHRIQVVEIDFTTGTMKVLKIIGNNFFFKPLGVVAMGNCFITFSHNDGCAYVWDGERYFKVLNRMFCGARFACKLPNGYIAICNQQTSIIQIINEDYRVPYGLECLSVSPCMQTSRPAIQVADLCVQTSRPAIQVADSCAQTSRPAIQVADSCAQTSRPAIQVADSCAQTSRPAIQVADSCVQTSEPAIQVADSCVQTDLPTESILTRIIKNIQYFFGYQ